MGGAGMAQDVSIERASRPHRPRVVVVGAGFGGLSVVRRLRQAPVDVVLLDRNNYHGFWPLLYQVATAGLEAESIAFPVRGLLRGHDNVSFRLAEVTGVDFEGRQVLSSVGCIPYDYLVLAAGSTNNYFGNDALAQQTFGMKDITEAEQIRNRVLLTFEEAVTETDSVRRQALLTFVIVGGGPTGVELAGAFAELFRHGLHKDFPGIHRDEITVYLVEATDTVLGPFPEKLRRKAMSRLKAMGVRLLLGRAVDSVAEGHVVFKDGERLATQTVIWAAGVKAAELAGALRVTTGRGGRVQVNPTLNLPERPEVFVIGDMAYLEGFNGDHPYPMVAPVAIQQGKLAAENILAIVTGKPQKAFAYFDKGNMATIGRRAAVVDAFGLRFDGILAWFAWLFVHLVQLVGVRNRMIVLTNWFYNYLTFDRGVRVITSQERPPDQSSQGCHERQAG